MFSEVVDQAIRRSLDGILSVVKDSSNEDMDFSSQGSSSSLKGRVPDQPVQAVVATPEEQFAKEKYPSFGIDLVDIRPAWEREHVTQSLIVSRDTKKFPQRIRQVPHTVDKYDLIYQITTLARTNHHDRALIEALLRIHPSRGFILIEVEENCFIPQWMIFQNFQRLDTQGQFRVFRKAFTYLVPTTLTPTELEIVGGEPEPG